MSNVCDQKPGECGFSLFPRFRLFTSRSHPSFHVRHPSTTCDIGETANKNTSTADDYFCCTGSAYVTSPYAILAIAIFTDASSAVEGGVNLGKVDGRECWLLLAIRISRFSGIIGLYVKKQVNGMRWCRLKLSPHSRSNWPPVNRLLTKGSTQLSMSSPVSVPPPFACCNAYPADACAILVSVLAVVDGSASSPGGVFGQRWCGSWMKTGAQVGEAV